MTTTRIPTPLLPQPYLESHYPRRLPQLICYARGHHWKGQADWPRNRWCRRCGQIAHHTERKREADERSSR